MMDAAPPALAEVDDVVIDALLEVFEFRSAEPLVGGIREWMDRPQPLLQGTTPRRAIREGRADEVAEMMRTLREDTADWDEIGERRGWRRRSTSG